MSQIKVSVSKRNGEIKVEAEGYQGDQCVTDLNELQNILGFSTITEEKTEHAHDVSLLRAKR